MRILFDHGTPAPLRSFLIGHAVRDAKAEGWNSRYQQNLAGRTIAIIVLGNAQWPVLRLHAAHVIAAVTAATPGSFAEVDIPVD